MNVTAIALFATAIVGNSMFVAWVWRLKDKRRQFRFTPYALLAMLASLGALALYCAYFVKT